MLNALVFNPFEICTSPFIHPPPFSFVLIHATKQVHIWQCCFANKPFVKIRTPFLCVVEHEAKILNKII